MDFERPREIISLLSISLMIFELLISPTFLMMRDLSITRTCSHKTVESRKTPHSLGDNVMCVSNTVFCFDVIGQIMVVGEYLFPRSF